MNHFELNDIQIDQLNKNGYILIKNFYNLDEIHKMKKIILYHMKMKQNMLNYGNNSGSKPDFINDPNYKDLTYLLRLNDIHKLMHSIFKSPFHLCFHNDIGLNRIVDWHKDTLNNQYKIYQKHNVWSEVNGEKHHIYKFLIYLQEHITNNNGLQIIEGSHLNEKIMINNNKKFIKNNIGDVIIFDQRITHRGQYNNDTINDRILISLGFGKNNIFTKEFEYGTIKRQYNQNKMIKIKD